MFDTRFIFFLNKSCITNLINRKITGNKFSVQSWSGNADKKNSIPFKKVYNTKLKYAGLFLQIKYIHYVLSKHQRLWKNRNLLTSFNSKK